MNPNEELIHKFYSSFAKMDFREMQSCYHPDAEFTDSAFVGLSAKKVKAMWHMLCENGKNFTLTYNEISANNDTGSAHWEARYTFSKTGKNVHNIIDAKFEFKEGLIFRHYDHFNFYRWASFAFGVTGSVIGWTSFFKQKVQKGAFESLEKFISKHPEYQ